MTSRSDFPWGPQRAWPARSARQSAASSSITTAQQPRRTSMVNLNGFNANEVEPTTTFEALPAGKYLAVITDSEMKPTNKGDGSYLQLEFTVVEGECKGRKVWDRLCINHPNDLTQKIARGNLSAICRAV